MTGPRRSLPEVRRSRRSPCVVSALVALGFCFRAFAAPAHSPKTDAWQAALAARASFEAEPKAEHSRAEFTQVLDDFRAVYHGNPTDLHAARAANAVAGLLAEQGRELDDPKSLRAAAGQYEFVAAAYPTSSLATPALEQAFVLLKTAGVDDSAEAARVRRLLTERGVRSPEAAVTTSLPGAGTTNLATSVRPARKQPPIAIPEDGNGSAAAPVTVSADQPHYVKPSTRVRTPATPAPDAEVAQLPDSVAPPSPAAARGSAGSPAPAVVTGIRHWSTASYTRVAIDLGGEVEFQAARTEHPDRIFFDLHGAKLAAGLAGKSFAINDDGFLKNIRAGQAGSDVTRIVLDVQPVAEYSAFLLPNPYRLIIDIHGRSGQEERPVAANSSNSSISATRQTIATQSSQTAVTPAPAPITRTEPSASNTPGAASSLPPMPVTDGSASFGLPSRRDATVAVAAGGTSSAVARPRVVVSARPTEAKPVPNSVSTSVPAGSREVAAVSEGPGVIAATPQPTSQPVVQRAARTAGRGTKSPRPVVAPASPVDAAPPTADGQSTLMRALGLKIGRIVIDAGHGGHDSGTLGPDGIEEKDVVLDVALRLGKLLHDRLGAEVVYTRADDTFVPLETRTAIANKAQADLFISVHANSSQDADARGVEVYYLNFTSDPEAMGVASRENAVSSQRVNQLSDLVKKIALKDKIDESRELAADVDQSLYTGLKKGNGGLKDRGVKKAPFVVLIGANMPSILAEISFVTNPTDAAELLEPEYRERVAESLYGGVARYADTVNGPKPRARTTERAER